MRLGLHERSSSGRRHYVNHGVVWCPLLQRDVDVERCLGCGSLQTFGGSPEVGYIECQPFSEHDLLQGDWAS